MTDMTTMTLPDGRRMPQLGFGVWQVSDREAEKAVGVALSAGYRSIDTAHVYRNEDGVGRALRTSGVRREDVFLTTKLWNTDHGRDRTPRSFEGSLSRLGVDYVDLYLVHWPAPHQDLYVETWKALVEIRETGRARSIGVSNFGPDHLDRIVDATGVVPALNQIELHPRFTQRAHREAHARLGVVTESWSPLGQGTLLHEPTLAAIAKKHGKTTAQVILRWHLQHGFVVIPKSVTPSRIAENIAVFDFTLDAGDMTTIDGLDDPKGRIGPNPATARF